MSSARPPFIYCNSVDCSDAPVRDPCLRRGRPTWTSSGRHGRSHRRHGAGLRRGYSPSRDATRLRQDELAHEEGAVQLEAQQGEAAKAERRQARSEGESSEADSAGLQCDEDADEARAGQPQCRDQTEGDMRHQEEARRCALSAVLLRCLDQWQIPATPTTHWDEHTEKSSQAGPPGEAIPALRLRRRRRLRRSRWQIRLRRRRVVAGSWWWRRTRRRLTRRRRVRRRAIYGSWRRADGVAFGERSGLTSGHRWLLQPPRHGQAVDAHRVCGGGAERHALKWAGCLRKGNEHPGRRWRGYDAATSHGRHAVHGTYGPGKAKAHSHLDTPVPPEHDGAENPEYVEPTAQWLPGRWHVAPQRLPQSAQSSALAARRQKHTLVLSKAPLLLGEHTLPLLQLGLTPGKLDVGRVARRRRRKGSAVARAGQQGHTAVALVAEGHARPRTLEFSEFLLVQMLCPKAWRPTLLRCKKRELDTEASLLALALAVSPLATAETAPWRTRRRWRLP